MKCACCGKEIYVMRECVKPEIYCTLSCMDLAASASHEKTMLGAGSVVR